MIVVGLNAYHADAAACVFADGRLVAALEEERVTRVKHAAGFPAHALTRSLELAGLGLGDVDHVAINRSRRAGRLARLGYLLTTLPAPSYVLDRLRNRRAWASVDTMIRTLPGGRAFRGLVHEIEHHRAHLFSAFAPSPFERSICLSVDGFDDFASAAWGVGRKAANGVVAEMRIEDRIRFPHSLGIFYQAMTQYLGFPRYGDEYKVMGLAAHGRPRFANELSEICRVDDAGRCTLDLSYFRHHRESVPYAWEHGEPSVGRLYSDRLVAAFGPEREIGDTTTDRDADFAASIQTVYEGCLYALLRNLRQGSGIDALVLAGGCAQNSLANGRIEQGTGFARVFVPPAAADAGGAIGAALALQHDLDLAADPESLRTPYLGDGFSPKEIADAIEHAGAILRGEAISVFGPLSDDDLTDHVAVALDKGGVVGWFQGRMEWGPRALGARSILADPRRSDMRALLNAKIKLREPFRPFAPAVLEEHMATWFELPDARSLPERYMSRVHPLKPERRSCVPAVCNVDGTGRPQSVDPATAPLFDAMIRRFHALTGVPMVLNTSFNENEPIVRTPDEAIACFGRTGMDVLAIGPFVITRAGTVARHVGAAR